MNKSYMNDLTVFVRESIGQIGRGLWDELYKDTKEGYGFFQLLESAGLKQFTFYYFLIYDRGAPVLIAPAFRAEFDLGMAADGLIKKAILGVRKLFPGFMITDTLFFGSPFGERGVIGLKEGVDTAPLMKKLAAGAEDFCRKNNLSVILFKDFPDKDCRMLDSLKDTGFFRADSFPTAVAKIDFPSFEEYVQSLGSSTRKSLRKKLKQARVGREIKVVELDTIDSVRDEIYALYLNTLSAGSTKFELLTKEFFVEAAEKMSWHARFFLYYVDGKLGAFNLCFVYNDIFIDKFIGFDYDISNPANLYFVSWCYNVEYCIKNRIPLYQTGQTDYQAKVRLGACLDRLNVYVRHRKRPVNFLLRALAGSLTPDSSSARRQHEQG